MTHSLGWSSIETNRQEWALLPLSPLSYNTGVAGMHETLPEICCPPRSSRFLCLFSDFFLILGTDGFLDHWKQLSPMGKLKLWLYPGPKF